MHKNRHGKNRISTKQGTKCMKLTRIQKPRWHKEERASFPNQFHTRVSKIHIPKMQILERKEGRGRRRRRRLGGFNRWSGFCSDSRFRVSGVLHRCCLWTLCYFIVGSSGVIIFAFTGALSVELFFIGSTSALWVRFRAALDDCTDVVFDFVGSSGVLTPVEPTLFKSERRINRWLSFAAAGSARRLNRQGALCARWFNRCVYRAYFQLLLLAICFRATSHLFLGLFRVGLALPTAPRILGLGVRLRS